MTSHRDDIQTPKFDPGVQHEPIAIVGMGCRLPGHVSSPSDLWNLLIENKSGHCAVPKSRYNVDGFYHPNAERPGSINSTGGYFLQEDSRAFDNAFFGINNLEASSMDAQQRKLLEVVYESFENAGASLSRIQGSKTGVYIGNFTNDYMLTQYKDPEYFSRYSATGSGMTILSNRVTHCFDLRGPSVVLDTACSSSIYALHFACLALDAHDCDGAVVASANLIQSVEQQLIAVKAGILSPDSICHTFDESANGYGRAEGVSSLYLKRLSDAERDGDPIRCVIRGTAINGNGRTPGIVQPSVDGQEAVIRAAYRRARLPTSETDYVEAHGTGTKVGDPIELEGISRVFRHRTGIPTAVGGIKPNLGHSEGASGLSSIIKLVLALQHGQIPATIGVKNINPSIKLDEWNLDIVRENRPWPKSSTPRASVNSFGFGGANGHAILEAWPMDPRADDCNNIPKDHCINGGGTGEIVVNGSRQPSPVLLTFSSRTEHSMDMLVKTIQVALVELLREWKSMPKVVIGHSSGEIGAAYAAGHLSSYQAIMAAYFRGRTVARNAREGGMIAVGLGKEAAQAFISENDLTKQVSLACFNSPESTTLSGDTDAIEKLLAILQAKGTFARKLATNGKAYHSKHMAEIGHIYQQTLERVWHAHLEQTGKSAVEGDARCVSNVRFISSVTGSESNQGEMATPAYWRANLESPVKFDDAVKGVFGLGPHHLLELGPHSALELPIKQIATPESQDPGYYAYNSALIRGKDSAATLLSLVGSLFLRGNDDMALENILPDDLASGMPQRRVLTDLPHYQWDYTAPILWTEPRAVTEFRNRPFPRHDLLGSQIPGVSKLTATWRNIVDVNKLSWLKDHCLGPSIVFPAAAYIAMAAEAVCQVNGIDLDDCPGVEMGQLNFLTVMDFHAENRPQLEVITEMRRRRITTTLESDKWWEFTVSSIAAEDARPTTHMTALVGLPKVALALPRTINLTKDTLEQRARRVWYDKFTQEGLNWGPHFAVMGEIYCDRARQANVAMATTGLLRGLGDGFDRYIAHPISIDAMLQTAFVATTGGWVDKLRATVPVKMDKVFISAPGLLDLTRRDAFAIDSRSTSVGFGTVNIEAELYNPSGETLIRMEGARCIAYQGNTQQESPEQRNPLCRVAWKPDIMLMDAGADQVLTEYTGYVARTFLGNRVVPESLVQLAAAVDLYAHKNPKAHVLLFDADADTIGILSEVLAAGSPFQRFETLSRATLVNGELRGREITMDEADSDATDEVIITQNKYDLVCSLEELPAGIKDRVAMPATLITGKGVKYDEFSGPNTKVVTGTARNSVNISVISEEAQPRERKKYDVVMVYRTGERSALEYKIYEAMVAYFGYELTLLELSKVNDTTIPSRSIVISTIESEEPILSTISEEEMCLVQKITDRASIILWVCHADFMAGMRPEFAPVLGLSRAVMLEQPSLRFAVFDVDDIIANPGITAHNACNIMDQLLKDDNPEFELSQKGQTIHSARWEPLNELNAQFRLKQDEGILELPIAKAGRSQLYISQPGQMDTIHFIPQEHTQPLPADHVEVEVKSVGMNAKDLYVLGAKVDTKDVSCSCECAGVIVDVGSEVTGLKLGDRVVAIAPGHFGTHERLPRWAVCKLQDDEKFTTASTIPIVFSTAIYGLIHRANIQAGESILIHSAAGGVGLAAIQLARHIGVEIFATVGNNSKKELLSAQFGLDPARIFSSRDTSFLPAIMEATGGRGVDVVLNSLTGELLRSSLEACAEFGRFVEIGKRDILDHASLDMAVFQKNLSLMAFDLSNLFYSQKRGHNELWQSLLVESMNLIRNRTAKPCSPIEIFRASEITQAFRHFSLGTRVGKVAVSFEDGEDRIRVKPRRYQTTFSPSKSYLMIGCLGGLGRSMSKWMISQGARSLVFLGRSGLEKEAARLLIDELLRQGADVEVVQGDVSNYEDVEKCIHKAPLPIGGVIHAAMGLDEALWSSMSHGSWHTSISPKVRGSWNLHNALEKEGRNSQLDFFVLTSSISGSVGTATESNYCAANSFLDAFSRYRNRLGRPAISIGYGMIAEVGYLHEHPGIEALLKRKGITSITEGELLQILDLAIAHQSPATWAPHYDGLVGAHILTGIEFSGLKKQRDRGFEGGNHVLADPRASLLAAAFERSTRGSGRDVAAAAAHQKLPYEVARALASGGSATSALKAVQAIVTDKISNLILLPAEQLRPEQKLGEFGIDSMLAAEFRVAIFHSLEVDVPFVKLLDKNTSVQSLAQLIMAGLEAREQKSEL
uniref:Polyketide synthase n=1 Tax=Pestalotiopsis sp. TaxID=36460 RepID=A0A8U0AS51_PESTX|nr:hypothetical protein [Pestalotiopsis sp.]